jgi:carbon-monoxide dehydrogenase medium subunit
MKYFKYFAPQNISETFSLMDQYKERAKLLAGGTDLLVQMKKNVLQPRYVVDLKRIPGLAGIQWRKNRGLRLGAMTTISEIESSGVVRGNFPVLSEVAKTIGSVQIRNRGTIGGNICRAAPSADFVPILMVMNAKLRIVGQWGERTVSLQDFFVGPGKTILRHDEMLSEIEVPNPSGPWGSVYLRHTPRQTMDLAVVGVAVLIGLNDKDNTCRDLKLALASVAPTPIRAKEAEVVLRGKRITGSLIEESGKIAAREINPISDAYGPAWYKGDIVVVLVRRAITEAWKKCGGHEEET